MVAGALIENGLPGWHVRACTGIGGVGRFHFVRVLGENSRRVRRE